jgi:hypothetical protein
MPAPDGTLEGLILNTGFQSFPVGRIITEPSIVALINASDYAPMFNTVYIDEVYGIYPSSTNVDINPDGSSTLYFDNVAVGTFPEAEQAPSEE